MKIVFTGGGSGGHIFPIIAIIREIRRLSSHQDLDFFYLGPKDEFGEILLSHEEVVVKRIICGKLRRYFSFENFIDFFKLPFGFLQSLFWLWKINPNLVFSKGGSGSLVVTFAAKVLNIPIFIHESDIVPGLSNQKTSKWAKKIFVSFPKTEYFDPASVIVTGNPIRKEILEGSREKGGEIFNLSFSKPVLLILGGSQGAEPLNDFVLNILNQLVKDFEVIHMTGRENFKRVQLEAQVMIDKDLGKYYHPVGFLDEEKLKHAYQAADLIISRAGSGSIFEIAAVGKPSILIPLPHAASNHQFKNAFFYSQTGACLVFEQQNLTPNLFLDNLRLLFVDLQRLKEMKEAALGFAKPLAAKTIAREILEYLFLI